MKRSLLFNMFLAAWLLLPGQAAAQDKTEAAITARLDQFIAATANKDWNGVLDLTYPALFTLASREEMLALFDQMENSGMDIQFKDMKINSISPVFPFDTLLFTQISYSAEMTIGFEGELYGDDVLPFLKTSFETTFGKDNVAFNKENKTFRILAEKSLFGVAEKDAGNWYFIENNPEQDVLLQEIIPAEVRGHFSKQ
ncbi:MAG: hypothetical protein H6562_06555 [Lewinellaceae bacterium]|nr:hypothetical protein [Lewinella sp.]MCB9278556.1 hypothetical protein [Lewinellaceae bacterium]